MSDYGSEEEDSVSVQSEVHSEEDDIEESSEEETFAQADEFVGDPEEELAEPSVYQEKFTEEMRGNYLARFHPEEIHKPFDEMYKLSQITRNANGVIEDPHHQTYPILTKYERAKIIGLRVSQLNKGAEPYVKLKNKQLMDVSLIAEKELQEKKLPFILMRPIPNRPAEYWNVNDLEYLY